MSSFDNKKQRGSKVHRYNRPVPASPGTCSVISSTAAHNSLPPIHFGDSEPLIKGMEAITLSKTCPSPNMNSPTCSGNKPVLNQAERKYFDSHWSEQAIEEAMEKGNAFRATFRVNGYNNQEAYCTIEGLSVDVLINGIDAQNRAIEGDIVAITLDPVAYWTKLKGSNLPSSPVALDNSNLYAEVNQTENRPEANSSKLKTSNEISRKMACIQAVLNSNSSKRPTGKVVAILRESTRRRAVIGFLSTNELRKKRQILLSDHVELFPTDPKFPKMVVSISSLPDFVKEKLCGGDERVEKELVAAQMNDWSDDCPFPKARIINFLGRGGEIKPQIAAILYENSIYDSTFSTESLKCIPYSPWEIPEKEYETRKDFRNICSFTIDPSSATDLDDALSLEIISEDVYRVGVHIADVSYFVLPDTALDNEAQLRSTSIYIRQHRLTMLPSELSEKICSLLPGVDRLAFSVTWDISRSGKIINRWFGRSVVNSCCKLSYDLVQEIIDDSFILDNRPKIYNNFEWNDIINSLMKLYEISKYLRENRFEGGALSLDNSKLGFLFDEFGTPCDILMQERKESCSIVEEFMLLANMSVAEVISMSFPDRALLRRHPEPNTRKLRDFETFCRKHGLELDSSSSRQLHLSLSQIRQKLKDDPILFDILLSYASKPMQPAVYFRSGEFEGRESEWAHYALSVPYYTHFTSPIRRYPDIIVHRTLSAILDAEKEYLKKRKLLHLLNKEEIRCFSGISVNNDVANSDEGRETLKASASKFKVPECDALSEVATYCNERKLASRRAEEAGDKLYLWTLLKKKEIFICEARVLGLGPRFMSVYINKFGIERRINYDEVEGLSVEWLDATSTLVLDLHRTNKNFQRRVYNSRRQRPIADAALLVHPFDDTNEEIKPAIFPLILKNLSTISVALHAMGGEDGPLEIGVRLYMCSYFK